MSEGVLTEQAAHSYIRAVLEVETNPHKAPKVGEFMAMVRSVAIQPEVFGAASTLTRPRYVEEPMEELEPDFTPQTTGVVVPAPAIYSDLEVRIHERYQVPDPEVDAVISDFKAQMAARRLKAGGMRQERPGGAKQPRTRANPLKTKIAEIVSQSDLPQPLKVVAEEVVLNDEATKRLGRLVYALSLKDDPASRAVRKIAESVAEYVPRIKAGRELIRLTLQVPHDGQLVDIMSVAADRNGRHERFLKEINAVAELPLELPLRQLRWGIKTDD